MLNLIEFVWIWTHMQGLVVPIHHIKMCHFLSDIYHNQSDKKALLMAFRNSGKSTIIGLFCAYVLWHNPNTRILILSADHELAKKMVRHIKHIIEKHPATIHLKPHKKEEWASDHFTIHRTADLRDPSVLARGLQANITGCRADLIICDDVEVPKTCDTASKRQDLRSKLTELDYILTPGGMTVYVGTPHTSETIYNVSDNGFLYNWPLLKIPILNKYGQSNWPTRYSTDKIKSIKKQTGHNKFLSQMMLQPIPITDCRLNPDDLLFYANSLMCTYANDTACFTINNKQLASVSCWWDPAFGNPDKGDNSVIACVFTDIFGHYYLHDLQYLHVPPHAESASWQCRQVADFVKRNYIPAVHLETNGLGKFLPALLRQEFAKQRLVCSVVEQISRQNKVQRILSAFDILLTNKSLFVHDHIRHSGFIEEMRDWKPFKNTHDDALDAVAGCLLHEPIRLSGRITKPFYIQQQWR